MFDRADKKFITHMLRSVSSKERDDAERLSYTSCVKKMCL